MASKTVEAQVKYELPVTRRIEWLLRQLTIASNAPGRWNESGIPISRGKAGSSPPRGPRIHSEYELMQEINSVLHGLYDKWYSQWTGKREDAQTKALRIVSQYPKDMPVDLIAAIEYVTPRWVYYLLSRKGAT